MAEIHVTMTINGKEHTGTVATDSRLIDFIREEGGYTGTKEGCGKGECGSCTIIMNGRTVNACLVLTAQAQNAHITTIEGLAEGDTLHPIQEAFIRHGAVQCGYCIPGMIMSAKFLLDQVQSPTVDQIARGLSGNLCRCTGYKKIIEAVQDVAEGRDRE